jgi:hypothetical protein
MLNGAECLLNAATPVIISRHAKLVITAPKDKHYTRMELACPRILDVSANMAIHSMI